MAIIGIDLGTTNSACSIWKDGKAVLIPNRFEQQLTPSVVGVDDSGNLFVGDLAKHRLRSHPKLTTSLFKRHMGSDYEIKLGKKSYTAVELSALVLRSLKEDAENFMGETVTDAVISVPAYFNEAQRKATKTAGELAGLNVERLINEPTAAAMVYGLHSADEGARFLVVDLGGGTFDVSLVEHFSGVIEVHASAGDNHLGGEDFLEVLLQTYLDDCKIKRSALSAEQLQTAYATIEQAKRALFDENFIEVPPFIPQQKTPWQINRERFEDICKPLVQRVQLPIERTLIDADLHPSDIDNIVLVGGATRMLMFRSLIARMFRRLPDTSADPDLIVAQGAAIQAGLKEQNSELDDIVLTDVCPFTLGTGIVNHGDHAGKEGNVFLPIIDRNTTIPVSRETGLNTAQDNQTVIKIEVYQGESRLVRNNVRLGEIEVAVPKAKKGEQTLTVRYSYDMSGLLEVDVVVDKTGAEHHLSIVNSPGKLSESQIAEAKEKLAALKSHPRDDERNVLLKTRAEHLYERAIGERRDYIGNLLQAFGAAIESQDPKKIAPAVTSFANALDELEQDSLFT